MVRAKKCPTCQQWLSEKGTLKYTLDPEDDRWHIVTLVYPDGSRPDVPFGKIKDMGFEG